MMEQEFAEKAKELAELKVRMQVGARRYVSCDTVEKLDDYPCIPHCFDLMMTKLRLTGVSTRHKFAAQYRPVARWHRPFALCS